MGHVAKFIRDGSESGEIASWGDPHSESPGLSEPGETGWIDGLSRRRQPGPTAVRTAGDHGRLPSTTCVHAGTADDRATGVVGTPIYQGSTFLLRDPQYRAVEEGYARDRFIYTRYGNPSQWAVQTKLAALEGAESAVVFSSGMGAISTTVAALLDRGGHVVSSCDLYGGTYNLFQQELPNWGMRASFVEPRDLEAIEAAIEPSTQLLFFEAVSNPLLKVVDIPALVAIARRHNLRLVVDATFATPIGMRCLEHGVDVVVHSASKYLNGHSDLIAGAAAGSRKLLDRVWGRMLNLGGSLDPHACFLLERGLKTLAIRMKAHQEAATGVAQFLAKHPKIKDVYYPGLKSHPDHRLASELLDNYGGMVTFVVEGGDQAALRLMDSIQLARPATSLGGVESLISLPFNTSHATLTTAQRTAVGVVPGTVRLSVGIEDTADLIDDLNQAIERATAAQTTDA